MYHLLSSGDDRGELEDVGPELLLDIAEEEGGGLLVDTTNVTECSSHCLLLFFCCRAGGVERSRRMGWNEKWWNASEQFLLCLFSVERKPCFPFPLVTSDPEMMRDWRRRACGENKGLRVSSPSLFSETLPIGKFAFTPFQRPSALFTPCQVKVQSTPRKKDPHPTAVFSTSEKKLNAL